jgi:hypothetical protein
MEIVDWVVIQQDGLAHFVTKVNLIDYLFAQTFHTKHGFIPNMNYDTTTSYSFKNAYSCFYFIYLFSQRRYGLDNLG